MATVAVLIPVLGRPHRVAPLVESIRADGRALLMFLCSPGDDEEIAEVRRAHEEDVMVLPLVMPFERGPGDYARKMNYGYLKATAETTSAPEWLLLGADDLVFHAGWLDAALAVAAETDACVIGTNDLGNQKVMRGDHATHPLVHRDYGECGTIDQPGVLVHEGYGHNWVDNEFIETAQWRGTFAFAADSHVEHLHPFWQKGEDDATYLKGRETFNADYSLFLSRRRLWSR